MDYSLYWVLGFLFPFTEHLGFILDFRKTFLGNPTLSSKFWSGLEAGSPGTLVYCLLKNGTALLIRIRTVLVLFSRECVCLNLPPFPSATLLWWNECIGFVSLVLVSRLFFSSCFLSMSSLFNVHVYLIYVFLVLVHHLATAVPDFGVQGIWALGHQERNFSESPMRRLFLREWGEGTGKGGMMKRQLPLQQEFYLQNL